jgi:GntR family transcriptional regulator
VPLDDPPRFSLLPPISAALPEPLYQQIVDGLKREIRDGRLLPHAPLPSFRVLAAELLVSVITVKRAYEELEAEGLIYRHQGLGTFVSAQGRGRPRDRKDTRVRDHLRDALREAREQGLDADDVADLLRELTREKGHARR